MADASISSSPHMAESGHDDIMRETQIQETRPAKRNRCCVTCSRPRAPNLRARFSELNLEEKDKIGGNEDKSEDPSVCRVSLHPCKFQVVIIVDAPARFKLSLDFLPCFQPPLDREHPHEGGRIVGSSHGLLLCAVVQYSQTSYYVCNPLTQQWVTLPHPASRVHQTSAQVGFISDRCTNKCQEQLKCSACKFQVVRFHSLPFRIRPMVSQVEVETFSSDIGEWTIDTVSSPREIMWTVDGQGHQAIFHHGRLHWLGGGGRGNIVVYDPYAKQLLGVIPGPKPIQTCLTFCFGGVGLSGGSIWLSQFAGITVDFRFWELKGYGASTTNLDECSWSLKHRFNCQELTGGPKWARPFRLGTMLAIHPHDPDIVYLQLSGPSGKNYLVHCNLKTKTLGRASVGHRAGVRHSCFRRYGDICTLVL